MSELEKDLRAVEANVQTLIVSMTRLSTMMENSEKRHDSDIKMFMETMKGVQILQEKVAATMSIEKDISIIREAIVEVKGKIEAETRTLRHDLNTVRQALEALPIISTRISESDKEIAALKVEVEALKTWRNQVTGAGIAAGVFVKGLWAVGGAAFLALCYALGKWYFGGDSTGGQDGY